MLNSKEQQSYLKRNLEPIIDPFDFAEDNKRIDSYIGLYDRIGEIAYGEYGEVNVTDGFLTLSFSYEPHKYFGQQGMAVYEKEGFLLKDFVLRKQGTGATLKSSDFLPPGYSVIFDPFPLWGYGWRQGLRDSYPSEEERAVVVVGDIVEYASIVVMFHEAGHLVVRHQLSRSEKDKLEKASTAYRKETRMTVEMKALVLKSERDAWAYAIKKLKPLAEVTNGILTKKRLVAFAHNYALKSHSGGLRPRKERVWTRKNGFIWRRR